MTHQLIKYEAACRALAECKSLDEVKSWADKAAALQAYGRMAKDRTMEVDAAEIRLRAERRLGEMLAAQKAGEGLAKPGAKPRANSVVTNDRIPTLAEAGISKDLSSRAQKLAAVPEDEFEAELAAKRERDKQDGARVSARLEQAGERHLKRQQETKPVERAEAERIAEDAHGDADPIVMLEEQQREIEALQGEVRAMAADDQKAETLKWRRMYDNAVRQQSEAMDKAKRAQDREAWTARQLKRCGKVLGIDDPDKIAPAVEAFVRAHNKVAA
jgi:hypothetical protein